jgi:hypothetical protein
MDAATLILTLTMAGQTGEQISEHPSLAECERVGLETVSVAPTEWIVSFECLPHVRFDTNLHGPTTDGTR